jgi:hypothetical protein
MSFKRCAWIASTVIVVSCLYLLVSPRGDGRRGDAPDPSVEAIRPSVPARHTETSLPDSNRVRTTIPTVSPDDNGAVEFVFANTIHGRVETPSGDPVSEAIVSLYDERKYDTQLDTVRTDSSGTFSFSNLSADQSWLVDARKPGFVGRRIHAYPTLDNRIVIESGVPLRGIILSSKARAPVAEARIAYYLSDRRYAECESDQQGLFEVCAPTDRDRIPLTIQHLLFDQAKISIANDPETLHEVLIDRRQSIRFDVRSESDSNQDAISRVQIHAVRFASDDDEHFDTINDLMDCRDRKSGLCSIADVAGTMLGPFHLDVDDDGLFSWALPVSMPEKCCLLFFVMRESLPTASFFGAMRLERNSWHSEDLVVPVRLVSTSGPRGRVYDCDETPLADCVLTLGWKRQNRLIDLLSEPFLRDGALRFRTDSAGEFSIPFECPLFSRLTIEYPVTAKRLFVDIPKAMPNSERGALSVQFEGTSTLILRLPQDLEFERLKAFVEGGADSVNAPIEVSKTGLALQCLRGGTYAVTVFDQGYFVDCEVEVEEGAVFEFTLPVEKARYLRCKFRLDREDWKLFVGKEFTLSPLYSLRPGFWNRTTAMDRAGDIGFYPVMPGEYTINGRRLGIELERRFNESTESYDPFVYSILEQDSAFVISTEAVSE